MNDGLKNEHRKNMNQYSDFVQNNEDNYKQKFSRFDKTHQHRQAKYADQVMSPNMSKEAQLMMLINQREKEYNETLAQ